MFKSYLKIAFRNLVKNKVYSGINIIGLSVGLACCILILLHVQDELSYDDFHPNGENIYRMALERIYPDHVTEYAIIPSGFAEVVAADLPEVKKATRLVGFPNFTNIVEFEDLAFEESYIFFADSNFFDLFRYELLRGDPATVLKNPDTVILTESTARKYFGSENPVGQTIEINNQANEVVGVMQDIPENSHMKFDFLASTTNLGFIQNPNYTGFSSYTYLVLQDGARPEVVERKLPAIVEQYASGQIEQNLGVSYEEYTRAGNGYNYFLQPITDIHLHSNLENEIKPNSSILYVYLFVSITIFILVIACINFVNLATARSAERAKEVGVRKVMGSDRSQLIRQFLAESIFISLVSLVLSIGIIQIVLPWFNNLAGKSLELWIGTGSIALLLLGFAVLVGLAAGLYPALYISSLRPVEVMKGKFRSNRKGIWLRNGLVVFQFAISIILISGTLVVFDQMEYIRNKRLGFDKENVLIVERAFSVDRLSTFKQELRNMPGVVNVAGSSTIPGGTFFGIQFQQQGVSDVLTTKGMTVDDHFFETMEMKIVEGRTFGEKFNDSLSLILNRAAVRALGIEDPVGARLTSSNTVNGQSITSDFTVVGVAEDFNFESLRTTITPLAMLSSESSIAFQNFLQVRLAPGRFSETVAEVEARWKAFAPGEPFLYTFLDNTLAQLYEEEQVSGQLMAVFSVIAIIIACVGLFGLAAYMGYQRTKEIGVRKVLGASVSGIVLLLSKDFTRLVGIAFLLALPIGYILMRSWLRNFAYSVELGLPTFLLAGIITLLIAWITISYQAVSAAVMNPAKSLRTE